MEVILIILILIIVVGMGYILCRPFFDQSSTPEARDAEIDLEDRYQMVLQEIKALKQDYESSAVSEEDTTHHLEQKKMMAAELLRLKNGQMTPVGEKKPSIRIPAEVPDPPKRSQAPQGVTYCPQCGNKILSSDKFCIHCGHPLQP